jgi:hypothetical protein
MLCEESVVKVDPAVRKLADMVEWNIRAISAESSFGNGIGGFEMDFYAQYYLLFDELGLPIKYEAPKILYHNDVKIEGEFNQRLSFFKADMEASKFAKVALIVGQLIAEREKNASNGEGI